MNLLLITDSPEQAAMLRQVMEINGLSGEIRRMCRGKSAVAYALARGVHKHATSPDLILLDFSEPDKRCLSIASKIVPVQGRARAPVILLTSPESEVLLRAGVLTCDETKIFAPTNLFCFIKKMKQHSRSRFLRALRVMSDLGPVLVTLPTTFARRPQDQSAMIA